MAQADLPCFVVLDLHAALLDGAAALPDTAGGTDGLPGEASNSGQASSSADQNTADLSSADSRIYMGVSGDEVTDRALSERETSASNTEGGAAGSTAGRTADDAFSSRHADARRLVDAGRRVLAGRAGRTALGGGAVGRGGAADDAPVTVLAVCELRGGMGAGARPRRLAGEDESRPQFLCLTADNR